MPVEEGVALPVGVPLELGVAEALGRPLPLPLLLALAPTATEAAALLLRVLLGLAEEEGVPLPEGVPEEL